MEFKKEISKIISETISTPLNDIYNNLEIPKKKEMGDFSLPCFFLSKVHKKSPILIAKDIANKLKGSEKYNFSDLNGYINIKINSFYMYELVISNVLDNQENYGFTNLLDNKSFVIDTFNANPLKVLHIGHLRNIVTGDSIYRILKFVGGDPKPIAYGGDVGTHVAKFLWYYDSLNKQQQEIPKENVSKWFGKIYIDAGKKLEKEPFLKKEIDDYQVKLSTDKDLQERLNKLVKESIKGYLDIKDELDVTLFDIILESEAETEFKKIKTELFNKHPDLFIKDQGAILADLEEYNLKKLILIKKNGSLLYGAKDIGLVRVKQRLFYANNFLYIVASEQDFYLEQLFKLFSIIYPKTNHYHISHGLINSVLGKMKSREGGMYLYEDFRDLIFEKVESILKQNNIDYNNEMVKQIAFGTIKFEMLKISLNKNLVFDINKALDFEGDSSVYLQYSGVRAKSILNKANFNINDYDYNALKKYEIDDIEKELITQIMYFKTKVIESYKNYKPNIISNYVLDLSRIFNKFYNKCNVLGDDLNTRKNRLLLVKAYIITLENALDLLGIEIPDRM